MATTSTNKQPLLVDRVFHNLVVGNTLTTGQTTAVDVTGNNESAVLVDCTTNDGGIVEDLYCISRSDTPYNVMFYMSTSADYLRPNESIFICGLASSIYPGSTASVTAMPKILAPIPQSGDVPTSMDLQTIPGAEGNPDTHLQPIAATGLPLQFRALYVPKGKVLWTSLQLTTPLNSAEAPIIGAQGGFY